MGRLIAALVRHGSYQQPPGVPSAHLPHPLTAEGAIQARWAAGALRAAARTNGCRVDPVLDCSPLLRSWQTARVMTGALGSWSGGPFRVREFAALAERSLGAAANLTEAEIEDVIRADPRHAPLPPGWKQQRSLRLPLPGAESLEEAGRRVAEHVERRLGELASRATSPLLKVFVGHGAAFRHAAVEFGVLAPREAAEVSMHHCGPVLLERQADGEWVHLAGAWKRRPSEYDDPAPRSRGQAQR